MKHEVGDVVRIRPMEWFYVQEKDYEGDIDREEVRFVPEMLRYAGKIAKITGFSKIGNFKLNVNDGSDGTREYAWAEWMFDPDYNPFGEPLPAGDAIRAMLDGEFLYDKDGFEYHFDHEAHCFMKIRDGVAGDHAVAFFNNLYRLPVKQKRPMTRWEILNLTNSDESRGWVVTYNSHEAISKSPWYCPQSSTYGSDTKDYWRARLLPDLSGIDESTIQQFEVEE